MTLIAAHDPRMATDIPPSIGIPQIVETRLGTLRFTDGFPDDLTVRILYESLDFQRAVESYLAAMPAASLAAMREGLRTLGVLNNTVAIFESLMDSRSLFLTANTQSVYAMGWLDLKDGPIVVETPPNILGVIDDFWSRYVADLGNAGADQGKGGKFLLLPPDFSGEVPSRGYYVCRTRTYGNWLLIRGFTTNGDPGPAVKSITQHLRIYQLARASDPPKTQFVNASERPINTIHSANEAFFDEVNTVVQEEPADAMDPETLGLLAAIGIEKGKPFAPHTRTRKILAEAAAVGTATARALAYRSRDAKKLLFPDKHWVSPCLDGTDEYLGGVTRQLDARTQMFFLATGITPAMVRKLPNGVGSQYAAVFLDSNGQAFDGGKSYRLRLPPNVPARDFWSVVAYDTQTRSLLQTDQRRPGLSSNAAKLAVNADGSIDIWFGPREIVGDRANAIQTVPGKSFFVALRLYGPTDSWFEKRWQPSDLVEQTDAGTQAPQPAVRGAMTTDIPENVIVPEVLDTRIGPLRFFDGVPDEATTEALYENLDFQRAVLSALASVPAAAQRALRQGTRDFGPDNQTVLVFEEFLDSRTLALTSNTESVYVLATLDLSEGPIVVESPPNIIGTVDDFWSRHVTDLGHSGPDRGNGGKYVFLPPGFEGVVPAGYFMFRSRTFSNTLAARGYPVGGDPRPAVENIQKRLRIYALSQAGNPPLTQFVNASGQHFSTISSMDFGFFEEVNEVVQEEPSDAGDPEVLGLLASIGIEKGQRFRPDTRAARLLAEATDVANGTARALTFRTRLAEAYLYPRSAWKSVLVGGNHEFLRGGARLLDARTYFHFYANGVTPALAMQSPTGSGWQYAAAFADSKGRPLNGDLTYLLHLPAGIPARDFWSLVVYDNQTRSQLQTDQHFPSISSQRRDLLVNRDGSIDVFFGPEPVDGHESNWIQTWPGKGWNVILRLYAPLPAWFDRTWRPGEIEHVG